jgi:hypothetical protein
VGILLSQTSDRDTPSLEFATQQAFTPTGTLGSWVFPPASSMEGWYYFGSCATLLMGLYVINVLAKRQQSVERTLVVIVIGWLAFIIYLSFGKDSIFFIWLWNHLPVFDRMREWARINVILIPGITLLLALAMSNYVSNLNAIDGSRKAEARLILLGLTMLVIQTLFLTHKSWWSPYWQNHFKLGDHLDASYWRDGVTLREQLWTATGKFLWIWRLYFDERFFVFMTTLSLVVLLLCRFVARRWKMLSSDYIIVFVTGTLALIELFPVSVTQWSIPYKSQARTLIPVTDIIRRGFDEQRKLDQYLLFPFEESYEAGLTESWDLTGHRSFFLRFFDQNGNARPFVPADQITAAKRVLGADGRAQRIFLTARIDYNSPIDFINDVDLTERDFHQKPRVDFYDGDTLRVSLQVSSPSWLSFIDNWTPDWEATVNGKRTRIELLFGSYKSVKIPAGIDVVEFRYRPGWLG